MRKVQLYNSELLREIGLEREVARSENSTRCVKVEENEIKLIS